SQTMRVEFAPSFAISPNQGVPSRSLLQMTISFAPRSTMVSSQRDTSRVPSTCRLGLGEDGVLPPVPISPPPLPAFWPPDRASKGPPAPSMGSGAKNRASPHPPSEAHSLPALARKSPHRLVTCATRKYRAIAL